MRGLSWRLVLGCLFLGGGDVVADCHPDSYVGGRAAAGPGRPRSIGRPFFGE